MASQLEPAWDTLHANLRVFIGRRVRNHADVDDLAQRVLLQVVKGLGTLRDPNRLHAWVYRTARHVIADYYRSPVVRREVASGDATEVADTASDDGRARRDEPFQEDEGAALRELAACMAPMLDQLPAEYREAVTLADIEGVPQAEAARRAGVSVSGMKSRVQRGRQRLKDVFEACCRIEIDRRGGIISYARRAQRSCGCDDCR